MSNLCFRAIFMSFRLMRLLYIMLQPYNCQGSCYCILQQCCRCWPHCFFKCMLLINVFHEFGRCFLLKIAAENFEEPLCWIILIFIEGLKSWSFSTLVSCWTSLPEKSNLNRLLRNLCFVGFIVTRFSFNHLAVLLEGSISLQQKSICWYHDNFWDCRINITGNLFVESYYVAPSIYIY